jgi:hypothetical protein
LNILLALIYFVVLTAALLAPFLCHMVKPSETVLPSRLHAVAYVAIAVAGLILFSRGGLIFPLAFLLLVPLCAQGRMKLMGGVVGLLLFAPFIWWQGNLSIMPMWQWAAFALLAVASAAAFHFDANAEASPAPQPATSIFPVFVAAAIVAVAIGWLSAPFNADLTAETAWHHWGAYLSPVELLVSGAVPYRDFPVQYGMGATLLIAASCGSDCWQGMFYVVMIANALYFATLSACTAIVTIGSGRALRALCFVAMFCATLMWTAFPSQFGTAMSTPSVAGLRFLPLAFQLLFILWHEEHPGKQWRYGHAIWLFNVFWSIESAVFATLLWWPWLAYRSLLNIDTAKSIIAKLTVHAAKALVWLVVGSFALLLVYRYWFGLWPEPVAITAYFQHPPGVMLPTLLGPVALFMILALLAIFRLSHRDALKNNKLYPCLIAMLAVFSYYLSRSHDNNILNLLPFIVLVAMCMLPKTRDSSEPNWEFTFGVSSVFVMSVVTFVATFNFTHWQEATDNGRLFDQGPSVLTRQFSPPPSDRATILPDDAIMLLNLARANSQYAPIFFDDHALMPRATAGKAWNSVNNIANYSPLPMPLARHYLQVSALHFQRPGWLIIGDGKYEDWLGQFATAYDVKPVIRRGAYTAYSLTPKLRNTQPKS